MKQRWTISLTSICGMGVASIALGQETGSGLLYMPDGQLRSHLVEVYVEATLEEGMKPCLRLLQLSQGVKGPPENIEECRCDKQNWKPIETVPGIQWDHPLADRVESKRGTLLLFNLRSDSFSIPFWQTGVTVKPVLYWVESESTDGQGELRKAVGREVYVGNGWGATFWAVVGMLVALVFLYFFAAARKGKAGIQENKWRPVKALIDYVDTSDNRLSLPLVQMALWTLAVGGFVLGFALVRLEVPEIPGTLVALMGFSAVTGLVGHWQVKKAMDLQKSNTEQESTEKTQNDGPDRWEILSDLVCIRTTEGERRASLAKGQMLFWTFLAIGIFFYKSIQDGALWEVPEQLVLLMGISQGSFLGREQLELGKKEPKAG